MSEGLKSPRLTTTTLLRLSADLTEECRLAVMPDRTPAEEARLRQLQNENALKAAGPDERKPRPTNRPNPHDA